VDATRHGLFSASAFEWSGRFRVYFNAHGPLPWSIDDGDQAHERTVTILVLDTPTITHYAGKQPAGVPSAWLEGQGRVFIDGERCWVLRMPREDRTAAVPVPPGKLATR
jgi:hypothetical protein